MAFRKKKKLNQRKKKQQKFVSLRKILIWIQVTFLIRHMNENLGRAAQQKCL